MKLVRKQAQQEIREHSLNKIWANVPEEILIIASNNLKLKIPSLGRFKISEKLHELDV